MRASIVALLCLASSTCLQAQDTKPADTKPGEIKPTATIETKTLLMTLQLAPDGKTLAVGGAVFDEKAKKITAGEVQLWDIVKREQNFALQGHNQQVTALAFSPDGTSLASGSEDRTVNLWDLEAKKVKHTLGAHTLGVNCVVYTRDGKTLASTSNEPKGQALVTLWDTATAKEKKSYTFTDLGIYACQFSNDGGMLLLGTGKWDAMAKKFSDGHLVLFDVATGKERLSLRDLKTAVMALAITPDRKRVAVGGENGALGIWDLKAVSTLKGHPETVTALAFSPDGLWLASASVDKTVTLWDAATGKELHTLKGHKEGVTALTFTPDGATLLTGSFDGTIHLWDVQQLRRGNEVNK